LSGDVPQVHVRPNAIRRLKTTSSERVLPLTGNSLWAAMRLQAHRTSEVVFPRYASTSHLNANSASASLNKWLQKSISEAIVVHSLRHAFRDRLRVVECPSDLIDHLGGWSRNSIGDKYGRGYNLASLFKWLLAIRLH